MRHQRHMGGSDGLLVGDKPHPRGAGTFARYLGRYVREEQVLSLPEAIVHLSALPARRLGLHDRGRIGWERSPIWSCSTRTPWTSAPPSHSRGCRRPGSSKI